MKLAFLITRGPLRTIAWQMLLVAILPLALVAAVAASLSSSVAERRFQDETNLAASVATNALVEKESLALRSAFLLAGLPTVTNYMASGDMQDLGSFIVPLKSRLGVDQINVAGMDGKIVASAQAEQATTVDMTLLASSPDSGQNWALAEDSSGLRVHSVALVRSADGRSVGAIEVGVALGPDFLNAIKGNTSLDLTLASDQGIRASTVDWGSAAPPNLNTVENAPGHRLHETVTLHGQHYLAFFDNVDSTRSRAILGVLVSHTPVEQASRSLLITLVLLGLAMSVVIMGLSYRIGQAITAPLQRLARAAAAIQDGDLHARVQERSKNEVRALEVGFNSMAAALERFSGEMEALVHQRTARLAGLHKLSTELVSATSLQQVAELPAQAALTVRETLGVEYAAVLELFANGHARVFADAQDSMTQTGREIVLASDSPEGRALVQSAPVIIKDVVGPGGGAPIDLYGSAVSIVIPGQERPFGVLTVRSSGARDFDADEVEFMQSVVNALGQTLERIRAVDELRSEHARTEHILTAIPSVLIGVDAQGAVQLWNRVAHEAFGLTPEDALRRPFRELPLAWDWDDVERAIADCVRSGESATVAQLRYSRPDGGDGYLALGVNPVVGGHREHSGYLLIGDDVTERRSLEDQLTQAQRLEAIGRLAAGIAHEINTPTQYVGDNIRFLSDAFRDLNVLLAAHTELVEAAGTGSLDPGQLEKVRALADETDTEFLTSEIPLAIEQSLEGIDRVAQIVRAMKEFSHPGITEKTLIDLNHAIETTIAVSRNEWKYVAEVVTDLDPALPGVPCLPGELNQAFLNIIVNAAHAIGDASKPGSEALGTITVSTRRDGEWVEVQIADTGTGIPEEIRTKIFDPFFTTKEVGRGTGQGLAIARSAVVDKHGGVLRCESTVGQGTTFIIRIPLPATEAIAA